MTFCIYYIPTWYWNGYYSFLARYQLENRLNIKIDRIIFIFKPFVGLYLRNQQKLYFKDLKEELNCEEASHVQVL